MKKIKTIFYGILAIYIVASLIFIFQIDNLFDRMGMIGFMDFIFYWVIIALILFVLEVIVENIHIKQLKMKAHSLEKEKNNLKAKLFDAGEEREQKDRSLRSFRDSLDKEEGDDPELRR